MKAVLVIDVAEEDIGREVNYINVKGGGMSYIVGAKDGPVLIRPLPEKQKLIVTGKNQIEKKKAIESKSLEQIKKGFINNPEVAFYCGYNACLAEITGETEMEDY